MKKFIQEFWDEYLKWWHRNCQYTLQNGKFTCINHPWRSWDVKHIVNFKAVHPNLKEQKKGA